MEKNKFTDENPSSKNDFNSVTQMKATDSLNDDDGSDQQPNNQNKNDKKDELCLYKKISNMQCIKDCFQWLITILISIMTFIYNIFTSCFRTTDEDLKSNEENIQTREIQNPELQSEVNSDKDQSKSNQNSRRQESLSSQEEQKPALQTEINTNPQELHSNSQEIQVQSRDAGIQTAQPKEEQHQLKPVTKIQSNIKYSTSIELDMHEIGSQISDPLDWVPIIRDLLFDSRKNSVNVVSFITSGKTTSKTAPVLRPLVFLTSKRLGFESYISITNKAVVFCDIGKYKDDPNDLNDFEELFKMSSTEFQIPQNDNSHQNNKDEKYTSHHIEHRRSKRHSNQNNDDDDEEEENIDFDNDYDVVVDDNYDFDLMNSNGNNTEIAGDDGVGDDADNPFFQSSSFLAVKKQFPQIQNICVKVICTNRKDDQAVEYAESFEEMLKKDDSNEYYHLIDQKLTKDELERIRNRSRMIANKTSIEEALRVLDVEKKADLTKREDGTPRFIPTIEIDLSHASTTEAEKAVSEVMDASSKCDFFEIVLNFSLQPKGCRIEDIIDFVNKKELEEGVNVKEVKEERINHFRFAIFNNNCDM